MLLFWIRATTTLVVPKRSVGREKRQLQSFIQKLKQQLIRNQLLSSTHQEVLRPNNLKMTQIARMNFLLKRNDWDRKKLVFSSASERWRCEFKQLSRHRPSQSKLRQSHILLRQRTPHLMLHPKRIIRTCWRCWQATLNQLKVLMLAGIYFWWKSWPEINLSGKKMYWNGKWTRTPITDLWVAFLF